MYIFLKPVIYMFCKEVLLYYFLCNPVASALPVLKTQLLNNI